MPLFISEEAAAAMMREYSPYEVICAMNYVGCSMILITQRLPED